MRLLLLTALIPMSSHAYELRGKVIYVTDGDTVTLLDSAKQQHKIRLYGIDAPERGQPYGKQSGEVLASMIKGVTVFADCTEKDRYKRDVCTLYLDGVDVNGVMVLRGAAWVYRKYYKGTVYYELEEYAKAEGMGLWHMSEYQVIPPWEWRKQNRGKKK